MLEEDENMLNNVRDLTIFPPTNACDDITDEDSGDEDQVHIDNAPASQLSAPSEIRLQIPVLDTADDWSSDDDLPLSVYVSTNSNNITKSKKPKKKKVYHWVKNDLISPDDSLKYEEDVTNNVKTPLEYFYDFFDESLINLIVVETNRYAMQKNENQTVSNTEIKAFIGVLILSGYMPIPRRRMFWEKEQDSHNDLVANAISRDRFNFIMKHLHFRDNNSIDRTDKFSKIRPVFQHLNLKFMEFGRLQEIHSIDESMVPYFGRHGAKQFIKNKPIRYGYKLWAGTSRLGYVYWFEPYQGISTNISVAYAEYGVGAGVVLEYADALRKKWPNEKFHLFFDNFFTSVPLLEILSEKNFFATGTVRENRLPGNSLVDSKILKKKDRGSYDFQKILDNNIIAVRWNDNSIVSLCSNYAGVEPIHSVKRYSSKHKQNIQVCK